VFIGGGLLWEKSAAPPLERISVKQDEASTKQPKRGWRMEIIQFQRDFNRKERKERRDKNLRWFFFAIFAFFVVNSSLVAACRAVGSVLAHG
jgi:hypothetical protein